MAFGVWRLGGGYANVMHGRTHMTIDPRIPTMPGRSTYKHKETCISTKFTIIAMRSTFYNAIAAPFTRYNIATQTPIYLLGISLPSPERSPEETTDRLLPQALATVS